MRFVALLIVVAAGWAGCSDGDAPFDLAVPVGAGFGMPSLVPIGNYSGDAMEPFITTDGVLLFNDSNAGSNTEIHWATPDGTGNGFVHQGVLLGTSSAALDAVPSLADDGNFFFVSTRSYDATSSTIYQGIITHEADLGAAYEQGVTNVGLVNNVSQNKPGVVEFDCEVSRDDQLLYYVVSQFDTSINAPKTADLYVADRKDTTFVPRTDNTLAALNTDALEYAPASNVNGLELYFTRASSAASPQIFVATRAAATDPFDAPSSLALDGYVEAPTLSADAHTLYFHRKDSDGFHIYKLTR
jgi:hypothetical protein